MKCLATYFIHVHSFFVLILLGQRNGNSSSKTPIYAAVFSQLSVFTADCLRRTVQMAGVEMIWELHTLTIMNFWYYV